MMSILTRWCLVYHLGMCLCLVREFMARKQVLGLYEAHQVDGKEHPVSFLLGAKCRHETIQSGLCLLRN